MTDAETGLTPGFEPPAGVVARLRSSLSAVAAVGSSPGLRRVQLALVGSEIGGWIGIITLGVVSFGHGGLTSFGVVLGLRMLAPAAAAPFLGLLGDRLPRRRVMVSADLSRVVLIGGAAAIVFDHGPVLVVYVLLSLVSVAGTAFRPAQAALLPSLARTPDELTACNAVASTIQSAAAFVGPALGGIIVAATDPGTAFIVSAATFVWSALLVSGVREPAREHTASAEGKVVSQLAAGFRTLVGDRLVRLLVGLIAAQVVVSGALLVFLAAIAFNVLHGSDRQLGVLLSALGIGGLLGAVGSLGVVGSRLLRSFVLANALWGAPIALLAIWQSRIGAFVLVAVIGFANTLVDVAAFTLLQRTVPEQVLGRVFGILESILYAATVVGALVAPLLVSLFGLTTALVATGLFLPAIVVAAWPALRRLEELPEAPKERIELLRRVPFLGLLPEPSLEHLAHAVISVSAPAGEALIRQGAEGDRFYVVERGEVMVDVDGSVVHEGGPGYYFGEIALLHDEPRTATVTARTDVELLALARDDFLATVTGHAESASEAEAVIATRLRVSRPELLQL
jgi:MFS family permease